MPDGTPAPPIVLPVAAEPAWRSYCAMLASKDAHFLALERLSSKTSNGERHTLAENAHIAGLLSHHDECVREFAEAMRELGQADDAARKTLLQAITELNRELGGPEPAAPPN